MSKVDEEASYEEEAKGKLINTCYLLFRSFHFIVRLFSVYVSVFPLL